MRYFFTNCSCIAHNLGKRSSCLVVRLFGVNGSFCFRIQNEVLSMHTLRCLVIAHILLKGLSRFCPT